LPKAIGAATFDAPSIGVFVPKDPRPSRNNHSAARRQEPFTRHLRLSRDKTRRRAMVVAARPQISVSKFLEVVPIPAPPLEHRVGRGARFAKKGERRTRYTLPDSLDSGSPVGYRTRLSLTPEEAAQALALLALERPSAFAPLRPLHEAELFDECSLGLLSARQSTNFRGHRQVTFGPSESRAIAEILEGLRGREAPVLPSASYHHVVLARPYRTPFTALLTLIGHRAWVSPLTVAWRALKKALAHIDDIPSVGFLRDLHLGILADAMERAAVIASQGTRRAQIFLAPFQGPSRRRENRAAIDALGRLCALSPAMRARGFRVAAVAQVGEAVPSERVAMAPGLFRKLGANLLAFRSERVQPGVNGGEGAPVPYRARQPMDVPEELTFQAGRAAYNAFAHWTGCERERAKELLLLERVDVLSEKGKERLRAVRAELDAISERVVRDLPLWAKLGSAGALVENVRRGQKAFALAGQRIYIGGLSRGEVEREGLVWEHAIAAVGAAAARSSLLVELAGCVELPQGCDLLAGTCLMAGPVNQNDIGKAFYAGRDLLADVYPDRDPTSLLVWTLKAKTVADPIGNEEQLLNSRRKGMLVDLRPAPHEVIAIRRGGHLEPMRKEGAHVNRERAFAELGNFVVSPEGRDILGNRGEPWQGRGDRVWQ
jgi:hypothetical protein